jgi:rare lipoprotein A
VSLKKQRLPLIVFLMFWVVSCAPRSYRPPTDTIVFREEGVASWYGSKFHGRKTSSGERYNMYALTAAHRTLPLGTIVRVTHKGNGRSAVLLVNDRGPFIEGRIIDLSYGAARKLAMVEEGVAAVVVEAYAAGPGVPALPSPGPFSVQVGSFQNRAHAEEMKSDLERHFSGVEIVSRRINGGTYHRVILGPYGKKEDALRAGRELQGMGHRSVLVRED